MTEMTPRRCAGRTADGSPCAVPSELLVQRADGVSWCSSHDPSPVAREARKLASLRGGESTRAKHRQRAVLDPGELGPLESPEDATRWARTIGEAVATGRLSASAGQTVTRVLAEWTRARDLHVRET